MLSYAYNLPCHQLAGTGGTHSVLAVVQSHPGSHLFLSFFLIHIRDPPAAAASCRQRVVSVISGNDLST